MIDYFFKFTDQATALADPTVQQYSDAAHTLFRADQVLTNVKAWRPSQDTTDGQGNTVHTPLAGWFAIVSLPNQNSTLLNHAALQFALNRDGPPYVIRNNIAGVITDVAVSPIFAGSHYPIGGIG